MPPELKLDGRPELRLGDLGSGGDFGRGSEYDRDANEKHREALDVPDRAKAHQ
jgi:hypothetical protein